MSLKKSKLGKLAMNLAPNLFRFLEGIQYSAFNSRYNLQKEQASVQENKTVNRVTAFNWFLALIAAALTIFILIVCSGCKACPPYHWNHMSGI